MNKGSAEFDNIHSELSILHSAFATTKEEHMKHGKRPTVRQKKLMTQWHLNYENWLVVKDTPDAMTIVHRATGRTRVIRKGE